VEGVNADKRHENCQQVTILLAIGFFILFLFSGRYIFQHFKFLMISQYSFCDLLPM